MKGNIFYQIILILIICLLKEVKLSEEEIIEKYGSIKTKYSSMIINTTDFNLDDDIYLNLNSDSKCDDYLRYQFYDELNEIYNQTSDLKYNMRAGSKAITNYLGSKSYLSLYYTINKNKGVLGNVKGNILYIEFKCEGAVEIKNTRENTAIKFLHFGFFIVIFFLIIMSILFVKGCFWFVVFLKFISKRRQLYNVYNIPNPVGLNNNQLYVHYPQNRIIYINQNPNSINNNINYNPNNPASGVPEYPPREINSENSNSSENMNSSERNLVSQGV